MRLLFGWLAAFLGAVSIALAARYGYKGADTTIDGVISAVVFGSIALCAFMFDAAAVRLWFMGHRVGSVTIGVIAAAALIVTFTNSLGAIAGRADVTLAERIRVADARKDDRTELKRLQDALAAIGAFTATDDEVVAAAKRSADTATSNRIAECDKRGPNCRQRETEEQIAVRSLASVTAGKATTDRATKLEADIAAIRARLATGEAVANPNPLGAVLALLLGSAASVLMAWQQAIVAAVFDLCLVGVMVIFELLGQDAGGRVTTQDEADSGDRQQDRDPIPVSAVAKSFRSPPERSRTKVGAGLASVKTFIGERVSPADGERIEMKTLVHEYRAWCGSKGVEPVALESFLEVVEKVCRKIGIEIVNDAQRVFCLNVRIDAAESANGSLH
jgi:hypothetical protein